MSDLRTSYLGFDLPHPVVASAGPATGSRASLEALAAAGVAAVVLPSLFEEDIEAAAHRAHRVHSQGVGVFAEADTYLLELDGPHALDRALARVEAARQIIDGPVIASLNGASPGGWVRYAADLVDAGADALELNVYSVAADAHDHGSVVEQRTLDLVQLVRDTVRVPLAVKLGPYVSALAHFAGQLTDAGADGLVLFHRFVQPDIDLETLDVASVMDLTTSHDLRAPLRWIAILHGVVGCSLACSGGVHTAEDAVKAVLAGADVVMTTSALLRHGPAHVRVLRDGLAAWLDERQYDSAEQARGSVSRTNAADPDAYERAQYVAALKRATDRFELPDRPGMA